MAALGVNTLQTRCSGQCLITLQDTSKAGTKAIRMTDGRCYYISAITDYIKRLIRRGMDIGHPDFLLPTRMPITDRDLSMLFIDPDEIRARVMAERARAGPVAPIAPMVPMPPVVPIAPMVPRPAPPPRPPGAFDPNRLYIPDGYFDGRYIPDRDARALRNPTKRKRVKRTKRVRKMTKRK